VLAFTTRGPFCRPGVRLLETESRTGQRADSRCANAGGDVFDVQPGLEPESLAPVKNQGAAASMRSSACRPDYRRASTQHPFERIFAGGAHVPSPTKFWKGSRRHIPLGRLKPQVHRMSAQPPSTIRSGHLGTPKLIDAPQNPNRRPQVFRPLKTTLHRRIVERSTLTDCLRWARGGATHAICARWPPTSRARIVQ